MRKRLGAILLTLALPATLLAGSVLTFEPKDPRWRRAWGTPKEVYAAWLAGWDISAGPPPHRHTLPPENTIEAVDLNGQKFRHNGIRPTGARSLIINDTLEEPAGAQRPDDMESQA